MSALDAALGYLRQGWAPIPLKAHGKTPACRWQKFQNKAPSEAQVRAWWTRRPDFNVGVVMGAASGNLVAVDIDPRNGGDRTIRDLYLPPTYSTRTGGGGFHCIYRSPEPLPKRTDAFRGIDLLGQGAYAVMPPSVHPSGRPYEVAIDEDVEPAMDWVISAMQGRARATMAPAPPANRILEAGTRNAGLYKAGCGFMRGSCTFCGGVPCRADTPSHIFERIWALNQKRARPPLGKDEVRTIATNVFTTVRAATAHGRENIHGLLLT